MLSIAFCLGFETACSYNVLSKSLRSKLLFIENRDRMSLEHAALGRFKIQVYLISCCPDISQCVAPLCGNSQAEASCS